MPADLPRNRLFPSTISPMSEDLPRLQREFQLLVLRRGDKEARRLWKEVTTKRQGRQKGSTKPEHDIMLLQFYDSLIANPEQRHPIKSLPRMVGQYVHNEHPGEYGATALGITARLRRLLKWRDSEEARRLKLKEEAAARPRSHRNLLAPARQNK